MKRDIAVGRHTLDEVQAVLDTFWARHDEVPEAVRMEIGIAAAEIAGNIVEHGHPDRLHMEIALHSNEVQLEFTDSGHPPEVDLVAVQMPDDLAEGGRGLALAQAALRVLAHFRDELGNHWRLVSKAFPGREKSD